MDKSPRHAIALIRNEPGEIALVRTERRGWELPGGQIELGESLTEGLQREIFEECGIQVELGRAQQSKFSNSDFLFSGELYQRRTATQRRNAGGPLGEPGHRPGIDCRSHFAIWLA